MNPLISAVTGAVIRFVMTALAARGIVVSSDEVSQAVYGLIAIGALGWSVVNKKKVDNKIKSVASGHARNEERL